MDAWKPHGLPFCFTAQGCITASIIREGFVAWMVPTEFLASPLAWDHYASKRRLDKKIMKKNTKSWTECLQKHVNNMKNSRELKCELHGIIELLHQAILVLVHEFCLEAQQCRNDAKRLCRCQMIPVYTQCTVQTFSKTRYSDTKLFRIFWGQNLLDSVCRFL